MAIKNIALFGGSFNPPHKAHLEVVVFLLGQNQFDEIWLVPSFDHPFEKNLASFEHRKKMCELTIEGLNQKVRVCCIEKELQEAPSYMINTIRALKGKYPEYKFTLVLGTDCRYDLPQWKEGDTLSCEVDFFFIPRPGFEDSPFTDISSTKIRGFIQNKETAKKYLKPSVVDYIERHRLYQ